jgi:hypothetical protein
MEVIGQLHAQLNFLINLATISFSMRTYLHLVKLEIWISLLVVLYSYVIWLVQVKIL